MSYFRDNYIKYLFHLFSYTDHIFVIKELPNFSSSSFMHTILICNLKPIFFPLRKNQRIRDERI